VIRARDGTDLALAAPSGVATPGTPSFQVAHQGVARHVQNVAFPTSSQRGAVLRSATEFVIADDPAVRQTGQAPIDILNARACHP